MSELFSPITINKLALKNRIVMSPMCMYSCRNGDGVANDWHFVHYASRAVGQAGLVMVEATAVLPEGRISEHDLGIWSDKHTAGLTEIARLVHAFGGKVGIQIAHAGRKAEINGETFAPSAIAFNETYKQPAEMTEADIARTVNAFQKAAARAKTAGFDVIEIHAAHGYLLNEFLSPLTNKRSDAYGGSAENRFRMLREVVKAVKAVWEDTLFVRISASDYHPEGLSVEDYVLYAKWLKAEGIDLIDCSSGGVVPAKIDAFPGYQVPFAEKIKRETGIRTGAVGLITEAAQAEDIVKSGKADLVFLGRALLRDPY
ncbi:MAG TPA: NADPH dehydrogenase NamA, partial [Bacilli bacterium]